MAKKSVIERNDKRKRLAKKYAAKRAALKALTRDSSLSPEERFNAQLKLAELPRNSGTLLDCTCSASSPSLPCAKAA